MPPPPARLSRATTRNSIVRFVVGSISPGVDVLFKMSAHFGNVLDALVVGENERKSGLPPLSGAVSVIEGPRSRSSQQYVRGSPSASLPEAVKVKGVPIGT